MFLSISFVVAGSRTQFQKMVFWSTLVLTGMACLQPRINCFVLVSLGVPVFLLLFQQLSRY